MAIIALVLNTIPRSDKLKERFLAILILFNNLLTSASSRELLELFMNSV